jgi:hypothetical protein
VIPTWLAIALPVAYIGMIPASMAGGGFVSALVWLAVARRELPALRLAAA